MRRIPHQPPAESDQPVAPIGGWAEHEIALLQVGQRGVQVVVAEIRQVGSNHQGVPSPALFQQQLLFEQCSKASLALAPHTLDALLPSPALCAPWPDTAHRQYWIDPTPLLFAPGHCKGVRTELTLQPGTAFPTAGKI